MTLDSLRVELFADGADLDSMRSLYENPLIRGFTTNPTLLRKSGVTDYLAFVREAVTAIPDRPISFEVLSDDFGEVQEQALALAAHGENVFVKIPVTNTRGEPSDEVLARLSEHGLRLNATALMTPAQVRAAARAMASAPAAFVSVFAGRVADTGRDPVPLVREAVEALEPYPNVRLIWASPRELLNVFQADAAGCHVITVTSDILRKLPLVGMSLEQLSLETVRMFHDDGQAAGLSLGRARALSHAA